MPIKTATATQKAESASSEAGRRRILEDFAESSQGWFWETDTDHRFTYLSRSVRDRIGLSPKWHHGKKRAEVAVPGLPSPEAWQRHQDDLQAHRPFTDFRFKRRTANGDVWLSSSGAPLFDGQGKFLGYRGIERDVTSEVDLRKSLQRLETAIKQSGQIFVLWDPQDRLVICNDQFREIHEAVGQTTVPGTLFRDHLKAALRAGLYKDAIGRERLWYRERLRRHKNPSGPFPERYQNGQWVQVLEQRLPNGSLLTVSTDITIQKEFETELEQRFAELTKTKERMKKQSVQLEKMTQDLAQERNRAEASMRSKSQFLAIMSHEIRTPMNGILGTLDLLADEGLSPDHLKLMQLARESAQNLLSLFNDILDYSKLESSAIRLEDISFSPTSIVGNAVSLLQTRITQKGLSVVTEVAPDMPQWIIADPVRLRQILFNLVGNAIKFTHQGRITIRARHEELAAGEMRVRFEIEDTGIGIAQEHKDKLFSRFTQADSSASRRFGGTGLGLAICKQLVKLMGGEIGVDSALGQGSTFWFTFSCRAGEDPGEVQIDDDVDPGPLARRRLQVLVAEDNEINQQVITAMLRKLNYKVDIAANGLEAVESFRRRPYDLVLMDVQMPEMDGLGATRIIRNLGGKISSVPIIAVTANAMAGDREAYLAAGMNDYVSKPIAPKALFSAIARQIPAHHRHDAMPERKDGQRRSPATEGEDTGVFDALLGKLDNFDAGAGC